MFPVIDLQGSPHERGRVHGEFARGRIERSLANYAKLFSFYGMDWQEAQRAGAAYREVIGGFDAELLEEIEGIARGAGRPLTEILTLNARTEILRLDQPSGATEGMDAGECTAIAVGPAASESGEALLAQNWDWIAAQREAMVLLRVRAGGEPGCLTLTEAGMLAKIGLNTQGLGVCLNILRSIHDGGRPGIPVHVLLRALLKRASVQDAVALASKLEFGGSSNILCADRSGEAAALEFSPGGLRVVRGEGAVLCHTNHFLDPGAASWQAQLAANFSSVPRLARLRQFAAGRAKHGVEDLKRILSDESQGPVSICRQPDLSLPAEAQTHTVASVIMELARGVMHVAPDVPSRAEYQPVALVSDGQVAFA